jgi:hypothetical protein
MGSGTVIFQRLTAALFVVVLLMPCGCAPADTMTATETTTDPSETGTFQYSEEELKGFEFEDSHPNCMISSDCMLMRVGGCLNVRAIHHLEYELAEAYTQYARQRDQNVQCAPQLPMDEYEALCLNDKCSRVLRSNRLLLEVPQPPTAGEPFWIGMSFRFPVDVEQVSARFLLPENIEVLQGDLEWSGSLEALEDRVLWIQVKTNRSGMINLSGWAKAESNTALPPLSMGQQFAVSLPGERTPFPESERIVPTPTQE